MYDPNHRPVENVYVELLNEVDSVIQRTKTDVSGRFTFTGVPGSSLDKDLQQLADNTRGTERDGSKTVF